MSATKTIIRTHADGSPALWTEANDDGSIIISDDNGSMETTEADLASDIAAWDKAVGNA